MDWLSEIGGLLDQVGGLFGRGGDSDGGYVAPPAPPPPAGVSYLPWIIGGASVLLVAGVALVMRK